MCVSVRVYARSSVRAEDYVGDISVSRVRNGPPRPIERAQAHRGFAHVDEAVLELFLADRGVPVPAASSQEDCDRKLELSMAAMANIEPGWTDLEATKALHVGFFLENPDTYSTLPVDVGVISEVVTASEAKTIQTFADEIEKVKAKKTVRAHVRDTILKKYFKTSALSQKRKPKAKACPRWWPKPNESAMLVSEHIDKHLPRTHRLYTDVKNGRWRVISEDLLHNRSVSWTERGLSLASAEVLHIAWDAHLDAHPTEYCPFDLNELALQFA